MKDLFKVYALTISLTLSFYGQANDDKFAFETPEIVSGLDNVDLHANGKLQLFEQDPLITDKLKTSLKNIDNAPKNNVRGVKEVKLFNDASPSVVYIFTKSGSGTGSIIAKDGTIITNWHVIGNNKEVGVIFKPIEVNGFKIKTDARRAKVIAVDEVTDLAIIKVSSFPYDIIPIKLAASHGLPVGSDVHAIGHPAGERWTYTNGILSQIRDDYEWGYDENTQHKAKVIQTQTPINPGNSGGPLLSDAGELIGVNTFTSPKYPGINFAVSHDEVVRFLNEPHNRKVKVAPSNKSECKAIVLSNWENKDKTGSFYLYDWDCDGEKDYWFFEPKDLSEPYQYYFDNSKNGKVDSWYYDTNRDGDINVSAFDTDGDGYVDLIGYHKTGTLKPHKIVNYTKKAFAEALSY